MEIVIAIFVGLWISASAYIAYRHIKREYENVMGSEGR